MKTIVALLFIAFAFWLLDQTHRRNNRVLVVSFLPFGFRGMFLPPFGTLISAKHDNAIVREHETCHHRQYQKLGLSLFYIRYFQQLLSDGYNAMEMEQECRTNEDPICRENYTKCYPKGV